MSVCYQNSIGLIPLETGSIVLSLGEDGRNTLTTGLRVLEEPVQPGRRRTFRVPIPDEHKGISVGTVNPTTWNAELKKAAVQMALMSGVRWAVVQISNHRDPMTVERLEILEPGCFTDDELRVYRDEFDAEIRQRITELNPGRNTKCICASGKKFKHCHGAR